jgi:hypothetical protein
VDASEALSPSGCSRAHKTRKTLVTKETTEEKQQAATDLPESRNDGGTILGVAAARLKMCYRRFSRREVKRSSKLLPVFMVSGFDCRGCLGGFAQVAISPPTDLYRWEVP